MKKVYLVLLHLFLISFMVVFTACDQEIPSPETTEYQGPVNILPVTPAVVFQVAFINNSTNQLSGFAIEKNGSIRQFTAEKPTYHFRSTNSIMITNLAINQWLSNSQKTGESVNLDQLLEFRKRIDAVQKSPNEVIEVANKGLTIGYFSYLDGFEFDMDDCEEMGQHTQFKQLTLSYEGSRTSAHQSEVAPKIVEWLTNLEIYKDLKLKATTL